VLEGKGGTFWADSWYDRDDYELEQDLAQVLEELRLRHSRLVEEREDERQRAIAELRELEEDRIAATARHRKKYLADAMVKQAERWEHAGHLRKLAAAIRETGGGLSADEREEALHWAVQIDAEATRIDPLPSHAKASEIPEPSSADLSPFMKRRSL
jgi:hypothetical protein